MGCCATLFPANRAPWVRVAVTKILQGEVRRLCTLLSTPGNNVDGAQGGVEGLLLGWRGAGLSENPYHLSPCLGVTQARVCPACGHETQQLSNSTPLRNCAQGSPHLYNP